MRWRQGSSSLAPSLGHTATMAAWVSSSLPAVFLTCHWRIATPCLRHQPSAASAGALVGVTTRGNRWRIASSRCSNRPSSLSRQVSCTWRPESLRWTFTLVGASSSGVAGAGRPVWPGCHARCPAWPWRAPSLACGWQRRRGVYTTRQGPSQSPDIRTSRCTPRTP